MLPLVGMIVIVSLMIVALVFAYKSDNPEQFCNIIFGSSFVITGLLIVASIIYYKRIIKE